jgi:hypothetical protein
MYGGQFRTIYGRHNNTNSAVYLQAVILKEGRGLKLSTLEKPFITPNTEAIYHWLVHKVYNKMDGIANSSLLYIKYITTSRVFHWSVKIRKSLSNRIQVILHIFFKVKSIKNKHISRRNYIEGLRIKIIRSKMKEEKRLIHITH